jgi:hypothetical protein
MAYGYANPDDSVEDGTRVLDFNCFIEQFAKYRLQVAFNIMRWFFKDVDGWEKKLEGGRERREEELWT